jgi:hypothetical protein
LLLAAVLLLASTAPLASAVCASCMLTVTGPPEQLGGPVADLYDTPFVAVLAGDGVVRGYSANSRECVCFLTLGLKC